MSGADAAGRAAEVTVRPLDEIEQHHALSVTFAEIWQVPEPSQVLDPDTIRALQFSGNYVAGAFRDRRLVGGCVAFVAPDRHLHSHIAGVKEAYRGQGIGYAMKLHQREWALAHRITSIQWTFDPAQPRNARFNLHRLGGRAIDYLSDFYGEMTGINAGIGPSDRLLVDWQIDSPRVHAALAGELDEPDGDVRVPIGSRTAVRHALTGLIADGYRITGATRDGQYTLRRSA